MDAPNRNRLQQHTSIRQSISLKSVRNMVGTGVVAAMLIFSNYQSGNSHSGLIRLKGHDGSLTVNTANTVLNTYAALNSDATAGDLTISIDDATALDGDDPLGPQDLVLIIQMQGATIQVADDTSYGQITHYGTAGNYEFAFISSVVGNSLHLSCGLQHGYTTAGHTQIIRVPQYTDLTIESGGSVTAQAWDGSTGGIVAIVAENTLSINATDGISVQAKGFRGGEVHNSATYNITHYYTATESEAGEKGEGIAGYQSEYDALGGRYGRGAAANGGGGGNAHNAGGGGGANGNAGTGWSGEGNMPSDVTGASAWTLDPAYIANGNALTTSSGGGRGGYTYANQNKDALTLGPDESGWGGDSRRQIGGLGGRPLATDPAQRIFMGGGGGAGSGNNNAASAGANGGGIVFLIANEISGSGSINASGADADPTSSRHNDGPGGGGGGGSVFLKAHTAGGVDVYAQGGAGGRQLITNNESEGPGGGGGGGYIALPSHFNLNTSVQGGEGGTTSSAAMKEFPRNGATDGGDGEVTTLDFIPFCTNSDHDQDGIADTDDYDDDNDGIPDWVEVGCTSLADFESGACQDPAELNASGVPHYQDASFCEGGALVNGVCPELDTDGDGVPDFMDRDSDQDGIPDIIESDGTDEEGDGSVDCYSPGPIQYTVRLTVTDDKGESQSLSEIVSLGTNPPIAAFSATPGSGASWAEVTLNAASSTDDGSISSYNWDYGDGNTGSGVSSSHTYAETGTYTLILTVTDNDGNQDTYTQWVTLYESGGCSPTMGGVYWEAYTGISGTSLSNLTGNSDYPDNPDDSTYLTTLEGPNGYGSNFGSRTRGYIYPPATGKYIFEIYGDDDCTFYLSTDETEGNIEAACYVDGWTSAQQWTKYSSQKSDSISLTAGTPYYFEVLHKEGGGGDHFGVRWTRPDDGSVAIINGTFLSPYGVSCSNVKPAPQISASSLQGSSPLSITFDASGSSDYDGSITSYAWDFGDGYTATGSAVSHSFTAPDALTDTDSDGWCDAYDNSTNGGSGYSGGTPITPVDTDEDGVYDYKDLDSDNDGLPDIVEAGGIDSNGDGKVDLSTDDDEDGFIDALDPDDDGNIGVDAGESGEPLIITSSGGQMQANGNLPLDNDEDNILNHRDVDSDQDGLTDVYEAGGTDENDDGRIDGFADSDGNGLHDDLDEGNSGMALAKTSADSDGDAKWGTSESFLSGLDLSLDYDKDAYPAWLDRDSDQDGIPDLIEAGGTDTDGDGKIETTSDSDGDGFDDLYDSDLDGDGVIDNGRNSLRLADTNGDQTVEEGTINILFDTDQDGFPNHLDLDSDNDGLYDITETGNKDLDTDQNGQLGSYGASQTDADADGLVDNVDATLEGSGNGGTAAVTTGSAGIGGYPGSYNSRDMDNDAFINSLDIDADGDGILDWLEAQPSGLTSATDGLIQPSGLDTDGDGIDDAFDTMDQTDGSAMAGGTYIDPVDSDLDSQPDYVDENSDNDSYPDVLEGHDSNKDGLADNSPTATDGDEDGLDDGFDTKTSRTDADFSSSNARSSNQAVQDSNDDMESGGDRDWRSQDGGNFPVEWLSFTAEFIEGNGQLEWATATETNNDYFSVERSQEGGSFEEIGQVKGMGTTTELQFYSFTDPGLNQLGTDYFIYRLRQVDLDGNFEYSNMVEIRLEGEAAQNRMSVYPNPVIDIAHVRLETQAAGNWVVELITLNGQTVQQRQGETPGGRMEVEFSVGNLSAGYYIMRARQGNTQLVQKFSIQ